MTLKITKLIIDHVEKIEAEEPKDIPELGYSQRSLTIWTEHGERYELVLEADKLANLEFKSPGDWLSPKLYKGTVDEKED